MLGCAEISLHVDEESKRDLALLMKTISVLFITKGCTCLKKKELSHFFPRLERKWTKLINQFFVAQVQVLILP